MKYLYVKSVFLWLSAVSVALLGACSGESFETSYDEGAIKQTVAGHFSAQLQILI